MPRLSGAQLRKAMSASGRATVRRNEIPQMPTAGAWTLPVIGMQNAPSSFQGGAPAWSTGSWGYQKPISKGGHVHKGVDIYANRGTAVVAPVAGTIKSIGSSSVGGNYVKVQGDDGNEYYYAHLDNVHTGIARGQRVGAGAYLGGVGNTGNASGTSPHLHFEIRRAGKSINPNEFIKTGRVQEATPMSSIAGLNTVDELQAYIDEEVRRANVLAGGAEGFDPRTWGGEAAATEEELLRGQTAQGQNILGATLSAISTSIGGGQRTPLQKNTTAMAATQTGASGGQSMTPAAEDLRPSVEPTEEQT